jgi:hypothetical protein
MQHVNVQGMALNPLPAVEQSPEPADLRIKLNLKQLFKGVNRTHLIGDRTDATDAGHNIGDLGVVAPLQERLEETGRLEYFELNPANLIAIQFNIQSSLTLNACHHIHFD